MIGLAWSSYVLVCTDSLGVVSVEQIFDGGDAHIQVKAHRAADAGQ